MKNAFFIFLFTFFHHLGFSQVNYLEIEHRLQRNCGVPDSLTLINNQTFLDSIIQLKVTEGKSKLLYDIGMLYYKRYLKWKNRSDISKSNDYFLEGWEIYNDKRSLWNLGICQGLLGDCQEKLRLTDLYVDEMKAAGQQKFISYEEIYYRYKFCK